MTKVHNRLSGGPEVRAGPVRSSSARQLARPTASRTPSPARFLRETKSSEALRCTQSDSPAPPRSPAPTCIVSSVRSSGRDRAPVESPVEQVMTSHQRFAAYQGRFAREPTRLAPEPAWRPVTRTGFRIGDRPQSACDARTDQLSAADALELRRERDKAAVHQRWMTYSSLFPGSKDGRPHRLAPATDTLGGESAARGPTSTAAAAEGRMRGHQVVADYHRASADAERRVRKVAAAKA